MPLKPTPTPLPPATPLVTIPNSYSLWSGTDYAIQSWNLLGDTRYVFQVIILVALVIVGAFLLYKFLSAATERDAKE